MGHVLFFSQAIDGVIPAPKIGRCSLSPTLVEMNVRTSYGCLQYVEQPAQMARIK